MSEEALSVAEVRRRLEPEGIAVVELPADTSTAVLAEECVALAGYAAGGVPPIAHRRPLPTLFDRHLLEHETVYAAAGAYNAVFAIMPHRLLDLTGATITDAT